MPPTHSSNVVQLGDGKYATAIYSVDENGDYSPGGSAAASTPTVSSVNASLTSVTLLEANSDRLHASAYNNSGADLYLKYGTEASASSFSYFVQAGATWEMPYRYTGIITGAWSSATGAVLMTELEP